MTPAENQVSAKRAQEGEFRARTASHIPARQSIDIFRHIQDNSTYLRL